jgi:hypothetical protein
MNGEPLLIREDELRALAEEFAIAAEVWGNLPAAPIHLGAEQRSYTPLTEFVSKDSTSTLAEALPEYAEPEGIFIDMRHLGTTAAWGGFYRDVTIAPYTGPVTRQTVAFHEYRDGSHAGTVATDGQPVGTGEFPQPVNNLWRQRAPLTLLLNTAELARRVQHEPRASVRDPTAWARQIDLAIGEGLRGATRQHLAGGPIPKAEAWLAGSVGTIGQVVGEGLVQVWGERPAPNIILAAITMAAINVNRLLKAVTTDNETLGENVFSVIPVWHFDRIAVVSALTRVSPFAKAL